MNEEVIFLPFFLFLLLPFSLSVEVKGVTISGGDRPPHPPPCVPQIMSPPTSLPHAADGFHLSPYHVHTQNPSSLRQVMRLCKPDLRVDTPLRFALDDLGHTGSEEPVPGAVAASIAPGGGPPQEFEKRLDLLNAEHASGITGMLVLPQSFGTIYLGEVRPSSPNHFCVFLSFFFFFSS